MNVFKNLFNLKIFNWINYFFLLKVIVDYSKLAFRPDVKCKLKDHFHSVESCSRKFSIYKSSLEENQNLICNDFIETKSMGTQTRFIQHCTTSINIKLYDKFENLKDLNLT